MAVSVRALLDTVVQALPEVGNLGLLFFLLFYIFAALGVELFGRVGECCHASVYRSCRSVQLVHLRFSHKTDTRLLMFKCFSNSIENVDFSSFLVCNILLVW